MVCKRYHDALNEVAAGGPAPAGFDAHLAGCKDCRRDLAHVQRLLAVADEGMLQLTAIDPSARFLPRVRAAVVESGPTPAWRAGWLWPSLVTAAVAAVAVILLFGQRPRDAAMMVVDTPQTAPPAIPRTTEPVRESALVDPESPRATPPRPRSARRSAPARQQVLIPAGEFQALTEFIALVNRERLAPAALRTAGDPSVQLAMLPQINIKPIEIVPLDPALTPGT